MKTIICGSGDVGYSIADKLSKEKFEVTVVDEPSDKLNKISDNLDVKVVKGLPSLPSVLMNAGAKDCEIFRDIIFYLFKNIYWSCASYKRFIISRCAAITCIKKYCN